MAQHLSVPTWPDDATVAVSLTFDVDGDPSLPGWAGSEYRHRLSSTSYFRYGPTRGLPRILDMLASRKIRGTFYVPGATAVAYPEQIRRIADAGHEIAHHGFHHLQSHKVSDDDQREEIVRGLSALENLLGTRPVGYRSPSAELTPRTFELLVEHEFLYDSSCLGDDRPYLEEHEGRSIIELPIDWHLDDAPFMLFLLDSGGQLADPNRMMEQWWAEFELAANERRLLTLVMHPEITGRGARVEVLARFVDRMASHTNVWFATHREIATMVNEQRLSQDASSNTSLSH